MWAHTPRRITLLPTGCLQYRRAHPSLCLFLASLSLNVWHAISWQAGQLCGMVDKQANMHVHAQHACTLGGRSLHTSLGVPDLHTLATDRKPSMGQCCQSTGGICFQCHLAVPFTVGGGWYGDVHTGVFISVPYPIANGLCCMYTLIANTTPDTISGNSTLFAHMAHATCMIKITQTVSHPVPSAR